MDLDLKIMQVHIGHSPEQWNQKRANSHILNHDPTEQLQTTKNVMYPSQTTSLLNDADRLSLCQ